MLSKYDEIRAKRARGDKGFTLIELLVVVVIMGILIAIAVPVYLNYQNNAKKKSVESDVRGAVASVEQCIADNGGTFGDECEGTFTPNDQGTEPYIITVSADNTVEVEGATSGYTVTGSRTEDPAYTFVYTSANGSFAEPESADPSTE